MSWKQKRKAPRSERQKLETKLDRAFSRLIRQSRMDENGICTCVTCGNKRHWKTIDCGHYYFRRHKATRWDPDNARPQCKQCNGGLGPKAKMKDQIHHDFGKALRREGVDTIALAIKARRPGAFTLPQLEDLLDEYNEILEQNGWEK